MSATEQAAPPIRSPQAELIDCGVTAITSLVNTVLVEFQHGNPRNVPPNILALFIQSQPPLIKYFIDALDPAPEEAIAVANDAVGKAIHLLVNYHELIKDSAMIAERYNNMIDEWELPLKKVSIINLN